MAVTQKPRGRWASRLHFLVRFLGLTGHHDPAVLMEAMGRFDFDTMLVALNAADVHRLSFIHTVLPLAIRRDMGADLDVFTRTCSHLRRILETLGIERKPRGGVSSAARSLPVPR